MGCEKTQRLLCDYLDSELNDIETKYVEKHLGECFNCLKEYEALKKTALVVGALPDVSVPKDFRKELSMRLDQRKASVFEIFSRQRVWIPIASVTLAAMFLIFVYNKEYTFLDTKESQKTRAVFRQKMPVSDTVSTPEHLPYSSTGKNTYSISPLPAGTKTSPPILTTKNNKLKENKDTFKKEQEFKITAYAKDKKKTKDTVIAKAEKEKTVAGDKTKQEPSMPVPATDTATNKAANEKPAIDDMGTPKGKELLKEMRLEEKTLSETSIPAEKEEDAKEPESSVYNTPAATGAGMMGGAETTDEEAKKDAPGKKKNAKITTLDNDVTLTAPANVSILHVDIFAPNPDNAVNEIMSIVKSYKLDYSFYRTITVTVPQNKINFLIGKLKAAGAVEMKSKFEPESSVPVKVKIMVKQREAK